MHSICVLIYVESVAKSCGMKRQTGSQQSGSAKESSSGDPPHKRNISPQKGQKIFLSLDAFDFDTKLTNNSPHFWCANSCRFKKIHNRDFTNHFQTCMRPHENCTRCWKNPAGRTESRRRCSTCAWVRALNARHPRDYTATTNWKAWARPDQPALSFTHQTSLSPISHTQLAQALQFFSLVGPCQLQNWNVPLAVGTTH